MFSLKQFYTESFKTLKLGVPVIIAHMLMISMQFVDTIMAGHISPTDLASLAIAFALFHPLLLFLVGIFMVITPIISQFEGRKLRIPIGIVLNNGLHLSFALALPAIVLLNSLEPLMNFLAYSPEVIFMTAGYLHAVSWGLPAMLAFDVLKHFNEGISNTKPNMYIHIIGLGLNILGNYTLMFGHFGFPPMGAIGAGWSTCVVWILMLFMMLGYCLYSKRLTIYQPLKNFFNFSFIHTHEILRIGIPNGFSIGVETIMFALIALMMGTLGTNVMAAHQIAINLASITFMIPLGLSTAITARIGEAIGRKDIEQASYIGFAGVVLCGLMMLLPALVYLFIPRWIAGLYTSDLDVLRIGVNLLFMVSIFQLSDGLQVGALGALRGLKDTKMPLVFNIISYSLIGLPAAYFLGFICDYGPEGLWSGIIIGLSIAAIFHNLRFCLLTSREHI